MAARKRRDWTKEEEQYLGEAYARGDSDETIGAHLNRSKQSVLFKRRMIGLYRPRESTGPKPYTPPPAPKPVKMVKVRRLMYITPDGMLNPRTSSPDKLTGGHFAYKTIKVPAEKPASYITPTMAEQTL